MKRLFFLLFFVFLFGVSISLSSQKIWSDELDDINKQINDLTSALNMSKAATAPLESQLNSMRKQINDIKAHVALLEEDIKTKKQHIDEGYKDLAKQEEILYKTIQNFYIKSYNNSPFIMFLSSNSASEITRILAYQKAATDQDKAIITNIALSIQDLEQKKQALENEQKRLTAVKVTLDEQSAKLDTIVAGAKEYQSKLSSQIAQLSAKQQELLAQKLGSLNISRSAYSMGRCDSDLTNGRDPGFSPKFAAFTYGVPNRVGMNQWGAYGRAKAGQSYEQILRAYYNFDEIKGYDENIQIRVDGYDTYKLDDYVKRIYEVPVDWPSESLKAQAIAARSYALAYTNNGGGSICADEHCQVFKPDPKGGAWEQAVNDTAGKVMAQGGNAIKAWFSSTHGGYIFSSGDIGWSSTSWTKNAKDVVSDSINSFDDLKNNAYDKDSPWFYCDWGSRTQYNKTAWLQPDELADIVNVLMLAKADSSTQNHLPQTDKPNPDGVDTWGQDRVKQELRNRGINPFNSIDSASVDWDKGIGKTNSITFNGDSGSKTFDGSEFKNYFNLRAPANINIVGPLYNVEKR